MQKPLYRATPQQLNMFAYFLKEATGDGDLTQEDLLNYLNDGTPLISEEDVKHESYGSVFKMGVLGGAFASDTITDARKLLPRFGHSNINASIVIEGVEIYGTIDFMGFGVGVMLGSARKYVFPNHLHDHNNWFMKAMEPHGLKELTHLTSDGYNVHKESYTPKTYDFDRISGQVILFREFLREYSLRITNRSYYKTMYHEA